MSFGFFMLIFFIACKSGKKLTATKNKLNTQVQTLPANTSGLIITAQKMNPILTYPSTKRDSVTDNYHGTFVADPYRWLEDENSPETNDWIAAQNKNTDQYFAQVPFYKSLEMRLEKLLFYPSKGVPFIKGDYLYQYRNDGVQPFSILYRQPLKSGLNSNDTTSEVFLDPNTFPPTVALGFLNFSHHLKYAVYSTSKGGSDWQNFKIIDVATKQPFPEELTNIKFSGASWLGNGFFYTRYDAPSDGKELSAANTSPKIYYHTIGTPQTADKLVYEDASTAQRSFNISVTDDEQFLLLSVWEGASNAQSVSYLPVSGWHKGDKFKPLLPKNENSNWVIDHIDGKFLVFTNKNAPRNRIVWIDPKNPEEKYWQEVVKEHPEAVLDGASMADGNRLILQYLHNISAKIRVCNLKGEILTDIPLPAAGIVGGLSTHKKHPDIYFSFESFAISPTIFYYNLNQGKLTEYFRPQIDFEISKYETKQVFFSSKDGTKIPMFITALKGTALDGQNPTLLYGYGGFNIARTPEFRAEMIPFLENGGVYAVVNLRGGSEFGEDWHKAGMLEKKQNVFDDCIAAAEYLMAQKYTNPEKLALTGRSNGGLLVGAVINQRHDLFRAALPVVGVMDMLRFQRFTIGWAWVSEYGSSENAEHFNFIYPYSPLHNIKPNTKYPSIYCLTADHDDRVVPAHSYKYMAQMQYANPQAPAQNRPALLRVERNAGHSAGKTRQQVVTDWRDRLAFIMRELGMDGK